MSNSARIVEDAFRKDPTLSMKGYVEETKIPKQELRPLIETLRQNGNHYIEFWYSISRIRQNHYRKLMNALRIFRGLSEEYDGTENFLGRYRWIIDQMKKKDEIQIHKILKDYGATPSYGKNRPYQYNSAKKILKQLLVQ